MSIKITVSKHWKTEKEVAYNIQYTYEVESVSEIPESVGKLMGMLEQKPAKYQEKVGGDYKIGPGHPPRRTINFDAPATKEQIKLLKKWVEKNVVFLMSELLYHTW